MNRSTQISFHCQQHEASKYNLTHLHGLPYMRNNCVNECRQVKSLAFPFRSSFKNNFHSQKYTKLFCNCSVAFLFPAVNYNECNMSSLFCLIDHNDFLNAEKPQKKNPFFDENEEGMECHCLPECSRILYSFDISPIFDEKSLNKDYVGIDIFYASETMMKYRTDVTFSGMDLLVGFGGVVGLFFGGSLLSAAEIIFFTTIALFCHHRKRKQASRADMIGKIKTRFPFLQ